MPNKHTRQPKPLYRREPPAEKPRAKAQRRGEESFHEIPVSHFELREDGGINSKFKIQNSKFETVPALIFSHESPFLRLYHGNCLELLDAIAAKHPEGRFDAIFADPPYFLSNGGITCHAGRMVKVDKGDWDKSRGPELNHEFNLEWLRRCRRVLKPNGTIWVSGTHHVIFSIGYAMQQLGYKILNDIAWEKPNPPPNLSCRYFTHSTETILWAARDEDSRHVFNYERMKAVTGKQMKTVWRDATVESDEWRVTSENSKLVAGHTLHVTHAPSSDPGKKSIWTLRAPTTDEKQFGKHPTQKPVALIERCLLASTNPGDLVLDPFLGGGTTAIAALRLNRGCVGIELDEAHLALAGRRVDKEIISIWLRHFYVTVEVSVVGTPRCGVHGIFRGAHGSGVSPFGVPPNGTFGDAFGETPNAATGTVTLPKNELDLFSDSINGSAVDDKPQVATERIFHETKFVFLSCPEVERGAVVHATVDLSLQEAWAKTPTDKKRETTHVVRCETEIFRVKSG